MPLSGVGNDLCLTRPALVLFGGNVGETAYRRGGARMDLSERSVATSS